MELKRALQHEEEVNKNFRDNDKTRSGMSQALFKLKNINKKHSEERHEEDKEMLFESKIPTKGK